MRKLTAMALSMMFILGSIIPVGAEETQTRQSTISVSIDPVYTVLSGSNLALSRETLPSLTDCSPLSIVVFAGIVTV